MSYSLLNCKNVSLRSPFELVTVQPNAYYEVVVVECIISGMNIFRQYFISTLVVNFLDYFPCVETTS